jgi:hypothetical protein
MRTVASLSLERFIWLFEAGAMDRIAKAAGKNHQLDINGVYFSGSRSKVCLHPAQQK